MNTFFCSWSGGKDSCLALFYAINNGKNPGKLLTMIREDGEKSRSHGLSLEILNEQADLLNIPLITCPTTWDEYEDNFIEMLRKLKNEGINCGVFGDIDNQNHRDWVEGVCSKVNMKAFLPLWQKTRQQLLTDFISRGFKALIVSLQEEKLGQEYLGKILTEEIIREFNDLGIDPSGENGEYHTVVIDGPIFSNPVNINKGNISSHNGYCFLETKIRR